MALGLLAGLSTGLSGCSDMSSKDSQIVDRPDGKAAGPGSFKPNVAPTKGDTKAEPL